MAIEISKATAPASWASYLINGDASGFDYYNTPDDKAGDRDKAECDAWTERLAADGWYVVSTEDDAEPEFRHSNDAGTLAGDVLTYILHREIEIPALDAECVLRHVLVDDHRLLTWDINKRTDHMGKHMLGYALFQPNDAHPIFCGQDFACSPLDAIDSDEALRGLLSFLTLKPGDTDSDYFSDYTPRQIAWRDAHAESLSFYAIEPDEGMEAPAFTDIE